MAIETQLADLSKQPIAIRTEHVAPWPTTIRVKQHKTFTNTWTTGGDFKVTTCEGKEETQLFSVDSEAAFLSQRRHFRDASGLPLFELAMKKAGVTWHVHLPGARSTTEPIARIAPRWYIFKYKIDVYVRNAAADGDEVKLEVRGQDMSKSKVQVYFNEASVMSVTRKNISLLYDEYEWIADVSKGLDLSLASIIIVVMSFVIYMNGASSYHGADRS